VKGWGTDHLGIGNCRLHFGNTPNHRNAAKRIMAAQAVETYGLPREVDPSDALLEEVWRTAGHVDYLAFQVRSHEPDELVYGQVESSESKAGESHVYAEKRQARPSVWLELYLRERKHLVAVCATAISVGIAERQVYLAEQQGRLIAECIRGVLDDLGVADAPDVGEIVRHHLTLIQGGK